VHCAAGVPATHEGAVLELLHDGTLFDHYAGYDGTNQQLVVNEWKNASADHGGNHGDIASTTF
jgi:hypothetical protein